MQFATPIRAHSGALRFLIPALLLALAALSALAQSQPATAGPDSLLAQPGASSTAATPALGTAPVPAPLPAAVQPLLDFRPADVRFSLSDLMDLLRDRRHEGWVLAAYPDPKTGRPLIGAGFSLDLPERQHPQTDPLNPHAFLEPSSAELWQAAGLDPERLQQILSGFSENAALWRAMRRRHRRVPDLEPEITDSDAESLLRVSAIQAIDNARAYCRNFDQLTGPQQMALSQLVYQMGVNLSEFGQFLSLINNNPDPSLAAAVAVPAAAPGDSMADIEHWRDVQLSLVQSQWARLYRIRAVSVIAMLDPRYLDDPAASEHRIAEVLHPARVHRRRGHSGAALRTAAYRRRGRTLTARTARARAKRKA